jgi:hypothetical protein
MWALCILGARLLSCCKVGSMAWHITQQQRDGLVWGPPQPALRAYGALCTLDAQGVWLVLHCDVLHCNVGRQCSLRSPQMSTLWCGDTAKECAEVGLGANRRVLLGHALPWPAATQCSFALCASLFCTHAACLGQPPACFFFQFGRCVVGFCWDAAGPPLRVLLC